MLPDFKQGGAALLLNLALGIGGSQMFGRGLAALVPGRGGTRPWVKLRVANPCSPRLQGTSC